MAFQDTRRDGARDGGGTRCRPRGSGDAGILARLALIGLAVFGVGAAILPPPGPATAALPKGGAAQPKPPSQRTPGIPSASIGPEASAAMTAGSPPARPRPADGGATPAPASSKPEAVALDKLTRAMVGGPNGYEALRAKLIAYEASRNADDLLRFGRMAIRRGIVAGVLRAASEVGVDPVLLMAVADKESTFSPSVRAATSSAMGLFQFLDTTWIGAVHDFGARHGLPSEAEAITVDASGAFVVADAPTRARIVAMRADPALSAMLAAEMLKRDGETIAAHVGRALTAGESYMIHFLGPVDADRFMGRLAAAPGTDATALLPFPARANRSIFYEGVGRRLHGVTVTALRDRFEAMMATRLDLYRDVAAIAEAPAR